MNVVAIPIIESNTELQGTRHSSMTARNVGGTTDRNSLSVRHANGAAMLVEVADAAPRCRGCAFLTIFEFVRVGMSRESCPVSRGARLYC